MAAYMHMGHDTERLVGEKDLEEFRGIILSPVNRPPEKLSHYANILRKAGHYDVVLDPQLYFPRALRGFLGKYPYFPSDLDTADLSSTTWWDQTLDKLSSFAKNVQADAVCSPASYPSVWSDDYFAHCAEMSSLLSDKLAGARTRVLTTVLVDINTLSERDNVLKIASILSGKESAGFYVVFESDVDPRREFADPNELFGMVLLIYLLSSTGKPLLVAHCSSDMLLFKSAGATHCATGKFFNLRRFTKSRYKEPAAGGGQMAYWFEQSLFAFLRESELLRLLDGGHKDLVGIPFSDNYWGKKVLENLSSGSPVAWIALGWRQYLSWFAKAESALTSGGRTLADQWLRTAEDNWRKLEDDGILMDDPRNDGIWLRPWRIAIARFAKYLKE